MDYKVFWKMVFDKYKRVNVSDPLICPPILDDKFQLIGWLRPITVDFRQTMPWCISLCSKWRRENPMLSLAVFEVTDERTERWLDNQIVGNDGRILFIIMDKNYTPIGHLGFSDFDANRGLGMTDALVCGEKAPDPLFVFFAFNSIVRWGRDTLKLKTIQSMISSDNSPSINLHKWLGFVAVKTIPLKKVETEQEIRWDIDDENNHNPEKSYILMELQ